MREYPLKAVIFRTGAGFMHVGWRGSNLSSFFHKPRLFMLVWEIKRFVAAQSGLLFNAPRIAR